VRPVIVVEVAVDEPSTATVHVVEDDRRYSIT
jgi:hypothetical protein